jgi:hypothetical protein
MFRIMKDILFLAEFETPTMLLLCHLRSLMTTLKLTTSSGDLSTVQHRYHND